MILRFGVENFRSFRDYTELSFVSTSRKDEPALRMKSSHSNHGVLPVLGVWGANAAGKSNILAAVMELRTHVERSYTDLKPAQEIPWFPFALRKERGSPPTQHDIDFESKGTRYHYGFRFTAGRYYEEWLHFYRTGRRSVLFERDHASGEDPWYFGPSLTGNKSTIAEATRPNSLFLSAAAQHNHKQLGEIHRELLRRVPFQRGIFLPVSVLFNKNSILFKEQAKPVVRRFLANADLGIVDYREVKNSESISQLKALIKLDKTADRQTQSDNQWVEDLREIRLQHGAGDSSWELPPEFESAGTNVLLARLELILNTLRQGTLLVADEFDASLHPELATPLLELFTREDTNPNGAQLLFTTQNRELMSHLRTDEVLLVDKARDGASKLNAASDYRIRTRDDLRSLHESGRVRGVPVLGDLAEIAKQFLREVPDNGA